MKDWPQAEYNIEGNPTQNLMDFIREVRPHQATFVPDSEDQFTSDHVAGRAGEPVHGSAGAPDAACGGAGRRAHRALHRDLGERLRHRTRGRGVAEFTATARAALAQGLAINAGHDLNRDNLTRFLREVPGGPRSRSATR
ncbi:pyridoxal phosphate biosynthesis protein pdxJ domain-containing protein [Ditylenchus destructor]|nr:pyridoxal phosphate biosynthesis protein pdxJ domain-containing protein [Ditylenchus destructor]